MAPVTNHNLVNEAARWFAGGRPDQAARLYAAALAHDPTQIRIRMQLADCLVRCNQTSAAAAEYMRVAQDYSAARRDGETMAIGYRVLHLDASQFVYVAVAEMLRRIGRPAKALCARAAEVHLAAGRTADGLHMLQLGTALAPNDSDGRRRLAQLYKAQHMFTDAVACLADAGRLLRVAGDEGGYVEVAEQILELDPRHLETLRELPRAYLRMGEPQRAVVTLSDLMRNSPGDTIGYETLAHAFAVIGRMSTSLSVLERLVTELCATGLQTQASEILERARRWRIDDTEFRDAVAALATPRPVAPSAPPRPSTTEGTVVLNISDLMEAEEVLSLDDADILEIEDAENTLVLRMADFSVVSAAPTQADHPPMPTLPPAPRRPPPRRPAPARRATPPRRAALPRPPGVGQPKLPLPLTRNLRPSSMARPSSTPRPLVAERSTPAAVPQASETTQVIDLADIELDVETDVHVLSFGELTTLLLDEETANFDSNEPTTVG